MSLVASLYQTGTRAAGVPLRLTASLVGEGRALERSMRRELAPVLDSAMIRVIDTVLARLLEDDFVDRALDRIEAAGVVQRVIDRLLEDGIAEEIADRALAGPESERLLAAALRSPLVEEAVAQLLENQAVWILVDEIARSPSVTEAIAHQGTGFLDQVAARARDRSRKADARVQRLADRLARRRTDVSTGDVKPRGPLPDRPV